jgi:uncharacterized membrane protein YbhN (UPF0104 family)
MRGTLAADVTITAGPEEATAPSLTTRIFTRRTVISLVAALFIVVIAIWRSGINWGDAWDHIRHANLRLYLLAVVVYYSGYAVRALRWQLLLRNAGERCPYVSLFETLTVSFFVNCIVPAKMGDLYRAFLLRTRERVSALKAFGTIIFERLLDLFVLMSMLLIAGGLTFRNRVPSAFIPYAVGGGGLCLIGGVILAVMTLGRGQRLLRYLPDPVLQRYEVFRIGAVQSMGRWGEIVPLSVLVWAIEAGRLACIVFALGDGDLLSPANFLVVALVAALLTTVPFLPGGLGLVEGGMVVVLQQVASVGQSQAVAIALLDRSVSYGTLLVVGFGLFLVSHVKTARLSLVDTTST